VAIIPTSAVSSDKKHEDILDVQHGEALRYSRGMCLMIDASFSQTSSTCKACDEQIKFTSIKLTDYRIFVRPSVAPITPAHSERNAGRGGKKGGNA
jgi:hypothetical protein